MSDVRMCPLCPPSQPMEHDAECDDWACPGCGLCAPVVTLDELGDRLCLAWPDGLPQRSSPARRAREALATIEREVARLQAELTLARSKEPAVTLDALARVRAIEYSRGQAVERSCVLAWLGTQMEYDVPAYIAAIERGEHVK